MVLRALRGFAQDPGSRKGANTRNPDEKRTILATPLLISALTDDAWRSICMNYIGS